MASTVGPARCSRLLPYRAWQTSATPRFYSSQSTDRLRAAARARARRDPAATNPEDDEIPMAQRVPLRKPSTGGLGVPGKVPSTNSPGMAIRRSGRVKDVDIHTSASAVEAGDADKAALNRQAHYQGQDSSGRIDLGNPKEDAKAYKERYDNAARRWTSSIIAMPILLVTSYYLFDRRESTPCLSTDIFRTQLTACDSCIGKQAQGPA